MTAVKQQPNGTEVVQWNPWSEVFPLDTRVGQFFDSIWRGAPRQIESKNWPTLVSNGNTSDHGFH